MGRIVTRSAVVRGRGPKRSTQWLGSADNTAVTNLASNGTRLDQTFPFGEPATIIRTRGTLWVMPDQETTDEDAFGAFGMAVVTDEAAAIGVTAVPAPSSVSDSDQWFLWLPWFTNLRFQSGVGVEPNIAQRFDFDSKAMRKVHDGSTAIVVIENDTSVGLDFALLFRMLIKLHG